MIHKKIKISVIVPAYNCSDTIETCLDSILMQSVEDMEVIVIDDGSTDCTFEIVKKKANSDKRLILARQENGGPSAARNYGIKLAHGEFLCFVDADDIILSGMLHSLFLYQKKYAVDLVASGIKKIKLEGTKKRCSEVHVDRIYYFPDKEKIKAGFMEMLNMGVINTPVGRLYKTEIIKKNSLHFREELDMGEDLQFNIDYIDKVDSILFVPDIFYQYNTFNSTLTYRYRENLFEKRKKSVELLGKFLENNSLEKNIIYYLYIKLVYAAAMQEIEYGSKLSKRLRMIKEILYSYEVKNAVRRYIPKGKAEKVMHGIVKIHSAYLIDLVSIVFVKMRKSGRFYQRRISV